MEDFQNWALSFWHPFNHSYFIVDGFYHRKDSNILGKTPFLWSVTKNMRPIPAVLQMWLARMIEVFHPALMTGSCVFIYLFWEVRGNLMKCLYILFHNDNTISISLLKVPCSLTVDTHSWNSSIGSCSTIHGSSEITFPIPPTFILLVSGWKWADKEKRSYEKGVNVSIQYPVFVKDSCWNWEFSVLYLTAFYLCRKHACYHLLSLWGEAQLWLFSSHLNSSTNRCPLLPPLESLPLSYSIFSLQS